MNYFLTTVTSGLMLLTAFVGFSQEEKGYNEEFDESNSNTQHEESAKAISDYYVSKFGLHTNNGKLSPNSDDKSNWEFFGPTEIPLHPDPNQNTDGSSGTGRTVSFTKNEITDQWYLGTGNGGLWTKISGSDWQPLTNDYRLRGAVDYLTIDDNGHLWCISMVDNISYGILKSEDNGATWVQKNNGILGGEFSDKIWDKSWSLIFDPNNQNTMYYTSQSKMYKSIDRGESWVKLINNGIPDHNGDGNPDWVYYKDLAINPANSNELWVGGNMIFYSNDGGANWTDITNEVSKRSSVWEVSVETHPSYPNSVWFYYYVSSGHYNYSGQELVQIKTAITDTVRHSPTTTHQNYVTKMTVSENNTVYLSDNYLHVYSIDQDVLRSQIHSEGTYNFAPSTWMHIDIRGLAVFDDNGVDNVFVCNDGGLNRSLISDPINQTILWDHPTAEFGGVFTFDVGRIGVSPTNPEAMVAGFWDMRSTFKNDNGWFLVSAGLADGTGGEMHPENEDWGLIQDVYGSIQIINTQSGAATNITGTGSNLRRPPLLLHPNDPDVLLTGGESSGLRKFDLNWVNQSATSQTIHNNGKKVSSIAIAPSDDDIWYLGYLGASSNLSNAFYKSADGGVSWISIAANGSGLDGYKTGYASDIVVNPNDANELWVAFELVSGSDRVYHSTDGGNDWEALVNGYPANVPATSLAYDPVLEDLYVGTFCGVLRYETVNNRWVNFDQCLPPVKVSDIQIQESGRYLYAGTYGRGIWRTPLNFCPDNAHVNVNFPITSDSEIEASESLIASAVVSPGLNVDFRVSTEGYIELQEGFVAEGSVVTLTPFKSSCMTCSSNALFKMSHFPSAESIGVSDNKIDEDILSIFPNPVSHEAIIRVSDSEFQLLKVEVIDLRGRARISQVALEGEQEAQVNTQSLESGIFVIKCYSSNGLEATSRFVKR